MIRRKSQSGWILFTQNDHAKLAGDIMNFWGNDRFSSIKPFEKVIHAINNHDSGWINWDNKPKISTQNHYPVNFMEMNSDEQKEIWINSFEDISDGKGYSSALIALHFCSLNEKSTCNSPSELNKKTRDLVTSVFGVGYNSLKDNDLPLVVKTNLKFLQIGDIISLALCHGWVSNELRNVPINYEDSTKNITLKSTDGFKYRIYPNPFSVKKLDVSIMGKRLLKKKFDNDDNLRASLKKSQLERFYFTIE